MANFKVFPVEGTNLFPAANTTSGGQLLSEWNLRCRETVGTDPNVMYSIGPSYVHSPADFKVSVRSSTILQISKGRGIFNGHYVETFANIEIDMTEVNRKEIEEGRTALTGDLVVGVRVMYSTAATMADSILVEEDNYYEGIQVVILPPDKFKLPSDVPTTQTAVTAHLMLATFNYIDGAIKNIVNNPDKARYIDSSKLANIDNLISNTYISKKNLDPHKLYTFTTKQSGEITLDTWCDSTDSLIVWDPLANIDIQRGDPKRNTTADEGAHFQYQEKVSNKIIRGYTQLVLPHKQIDGLTDYYYPDRIIDLPTADYNTGSGGAVDINYTNRVKKIAEDIQQLYHLSSGKLKKFIQNLTSKDARDSDESHLPSVEEVKNWTPGDYVLVAQDSTVIYTNSIDSTSLASPSTMYVAIPGQVTDITSSGSTTRASLEVPVSIPTAVANKKGVEIATVHFSSSDNITVDMVKAQVSLQSFRGAVQQDYIRAECIVSDTQVKDYFFLVSTNTGTELSLDPVWLTGTVPLAMQDVVGGFLNVDVADSGQGYVYRDDSGHLRLVDYEILYSGVLAYQLGTNITVPKYGVDELQQYLDDYVNERVAFPNADTESNENFTPNVLHLYITVPTEYSAGDAINIRNIDSRFGTSVYLHILANSSNASSSKITFNIDGCEKLRISNSIPSNVTINVSRTNLYYDAYVMSKLNKIEELGLWYARYSDADPNLQVDGMTVTALGKPRLVSSEDYWGESVPNDNHYVYALRTITFSSTGQIIRAGLLISDSTTANIAVSAANTSSGKMAASGKFVLPQGSGLAYPKNRLTDNIKITGSFVTAYPSTSPVGYVLKTTQFTAVTQKYADDGQTEIAGDITFYTDASIVTATSGIAPGATLDGWASGKFHIFFGGIVS